MLSWSWPSFSFSRRRKPSERASPDLEPQAEEPEEDTPVAASEPINQPMEEPETRESVLVDPGSELRAEIVLIAETRVCYGLVGLTPQEG